MDALVTIVAPVRASDIPEIEAAIDLLGNPVVGHIRDALKACDPDGGGTHFMSLSALPGDEGRGHLILEFTGDGNEDRALERIFTAIGAELEPIFARATDWRSNVGLLGYLRSHRFKVGPGLFDHPGLCFAGTPGMSVGRIQRERDLADFVAQLVDDGPAGMRPLDRLAAIRHEVAARPEHCWALEPPSPPGRGELDFSLSKGIGLFAGSFIRTFLWPLGVVLVLIFFAVLIVQEAHMIEGMEGDAFHALAHTLKALAVLVVATVVGLIALYSALRRQEDSDWVDERAADAATLREIGKRENYCAQNHMISVTERKPGLVRWFTIRLVFWLIGQLASRVYRPGFLGGISTIHAARWVTIPGTRKLIFFSNYGGSWESYLEDFITRAHGGLTAVWSNSIGFPKSKNLFQDGATDGERFKRYARASMVPTRFWYSAYPDLTTDHVRTNATMRRGLAAALTNDEAAAWLSLFGSALRPDAKLDTMEIQSLVFGGLGFMTHGVCLLYRLPDDKEHARDFMAAIEEDVGFGDGRKLRRRAVLTVGLGGPALSKLGLPRECVSGFPAAFLEGMSSEHRARILGDFGDDGPAFWQWSDGQFDLALLAYGYDHEAVAELEGKVADHAAENGMESGHRIPLTPVKKPAIEPFGFVDGISQPVIRGSFQSFRKNDPIHLVEPGEFVIGYPDNRGNFPPEPLLSPLADPENVLPIAERSREFANSLVDCPRAIGRNGTFLVIRQLEQNVKGFKKFCGDEAERLKYRLPAPYYVTPDFIAAKLIGRWPDGSSLVRNPYYPLPKERKEREDRRARRETALGFTDTQALIAVGDPLGSETNRPETNPPAGTRIYAAPQPGAVGDNDFLYGVEDPQALRCPLGAHIRRANPRDSFEPGSMEQVSISNRHRIYRVGRLYEPQGDDDPGLLFMCLNGDIERQFEFIQQTWLVSPAFHGLVGEQDPLNSHGKRGSLDCHDDQDQLNSRDDKDQRNSHGVPKPRGYLIPTQDGPMRLEPLPQWVKTLGGGYFFMPSRSMLAFLAGKRSRPIHEPQRREAEAR